MSVDASATPRYAQPMDPPEPGRACGDCAHYCDLRVVRNPGVGTVGELMGRPVRGELVEWAGVCCVDRDDGDLTADVYQVDPDADPDDVGCTDWVER